MVQPTKPAVTFNPLSVTGCAVWYDLTHCTTGGGLVTALPDQSGNARNATITGGSEPSYTATSASFNNRPVMTFPALDSKSVTAPNLGITTGARTFVIVCDVNVDNAIIVSSVAGLLARGLSGAFDVGDGGTDLMGGSVAAPVVLVWVDNGASSKLYVSALTAVATGSSATPDLTAQTMMLGNYQSAPGSSFSQTGSTTHFLVYSGALSNSDCGYLLSGFGTQSGITIGA